MQIITDCDQGSDRWNSLRVGSVGGSSITHVLAKGQGKSRKSLMYQLAAEILSGRKTDTYKTPAMERGTDLEPEARQYYEFVTGNTVDQVALIKADFPGTHVSPDGLIGEDGGLEIKCPLPTTHIETIDTGKIDLKYIRQINHFFWVSGYVFCDFVSYSPEIKDCPIWIKRITPDQNIQAEISIELPIFIEELAQLVKKIKKSM